MALRIDILTLFPRMLDGFLAESILGKGIASGRLSVAVHDLRRWTLDKHRTADDRPFGGGAGMVMKPEPVFAAIEAVADAAAAGGYISRPTARPFLRRSRASCPSRPPDIAQRALRRDRPADPRPGDRSGDQHRGLCAHERHAGGGGVDRRAEPFYSRRLGRGKVIDARIFQRQVARLPSIHASRRISGHVRAGGPPLRQPCRNRKMAAREVRWKRPVKSVPI